MAEKRKIADIAPPPIGNEPLPEIIARAGKPLKWYNRPLKDKARIIEALEMVYDPDVMIDVYNLGLIYKTELDEKGNVHIEMTLTSPTCPMAEEMPHMVAEAVAALAGVGEVEVKLVWEPAWDLSKLSDAAKLQLDMTDLEIY